MKVNKIKQKRLEVGFMQYAVAKKLGISRRHYQRFENEGRKPSNDLLKKLSIILNCEIKELI